jgi:aspartyl/glutamyl-tRNA(Asn/Gln) amidotransferase C subunit
MSQLTIEDIKKLADLAKIEITVAETENYLKDINNILGHLSMVGQADVSDADRHLRFYNSLRTDILEKRDFDRETIFENIPNKSKDNYVKVSKVIKK